MTTPIPPRKPLKKVHVIEKEKAVFRLDGNGVWHTENGPFENRRIIDHFHRSIRTDDAGHHIYQEHSTHIEKVYFPCEDTPYFANRVMEECRLLVLNTEERIPLDPERLFMNGDSLYMHFGRKRIKFTPNALVSISADLEEEDGRIYIRTGEGRCRIPTE